MSAETVTHHAFVPAWEIDANDHWNTAFYVRAFQQASERFAQGVPGPQPAAPPEVFHVRFFRELRLLETLSIGSVRLSEARAPYGVAHIIREGSSGRVAASALELRGDGLGPDPQGSDAEAYAPRSLPPGPHGVSDTGAALAEGRATVTHAGILRPEDFDGTGKLLMSALHMRVSDGNGHLWQFVGVSSDAFYGRGLGRAIVELKITRQGNAAPGTPVRQVSWFREIGRKSIEIRHQLEDLRTGAALSSISTITLILDMAARKSTELPPDLAEALRAAGA
ncbi:acyl-CoA thioesterase [Salipiger abyssi]|uniref:acyl-CoA thioesterase n=1 Tax=Salipiger abyssi TaxID=1250539 RepID=UPI001A8CACBB|nr:thioesterase family protein [Salipiger abyssi]MBN9889328.1 thioesterase family protein [Salipiger abyssi]